MRYGSIFGQQDITKQSKRFYPNGIWTEVKDLNGVVKSIERDQPNVFYNTISNSSISLLSLQHWKNVLDTIRAMTSGEQMNRGSDFFNKLAIGISGASYTEDDIKQCESMSLDSSMYCNYAVTHTRNCNVCQEKVISILDCFVVNLSSRHCPKLYRLICKVYPGLIAMVIWNDGDIRVDAYSAETFPCGVQSCHYLNPNREWTYVVHIQHPEQQKQKKVWTMTRK
ncbi:hypothetical protein RFI_35169 [Reticulomyxa filosa]|uniref:Uncharacterized protein n=1 Tax=Reticulomyxa filosa TaxID=46433 RepID=X6LM91_RETFI|nr:hypothetical protein RFI_35169 [Reticulomyxa filosa]|eukprot:ETO02267.1 hypothetical protein RFI_35169 [Reticulomyxa filosa]